MARWVPFTAHIRIVPDHGSGVLKSKRFENWRDMQKIGTLIFDALEQNANLNLASPGGGQHQSFGGTGGGGLSGLTNGTAVKPQIGETPAQAMITGFFNSNDKNFQEHPDYELISGGESFTGPGPAAVLQNPTTAIEVGLKVLKGIIETELAGALPAGITYSVFRIEYAGIVYGDRGYHFPR